MANNQNLNPCKPGETHNPNGRPKGALNVKTRIRRILEAYSNGEDVDNIDAMIIKLTQRVMKKGDPVAFDKLMDRLEGKPNQKIDTTITERNKLPAGLTKADLKKLAKLGDK